MQGSQEGIGMLGVSVQIKIYLKKKNEVAKT